MNGEVDDELRALLKIQVGAKSGGEKTMATAWIDTVFNGGLVLPRTGNRRDHSRS